MSKWDKAQEQVNKSSSGDFYALVEGDNKMRLLEVPEVIASHYYQNNPQGKKNFTCIADDKGEGCEHCVRGERRRVQYMCNAIIRQKGGDVVSIVKFGTTVMEALLLLRKDGDYGFETDLPNYDINIKKVKTGSAATDVEYTVLPLPAKDLSEADVTMSSAIKPTSEIISGMLKKEKERQKTEVEDLAPVPTEDIPM